LPPVYHATKFALEGLSESLRYELSLHGIKVKLVEPGHFKTGFISRSLQCSGHSSYKAEFVPPQPGILLLLLRPRRIGGCPSRFLATSFA
jgi:short-subunit dehydrogenase